MLIRGEIYQGTYAPETWQLGKLPLKSRPVIPAVSFLHWCHYVETSRVTFLHLLEMITTAEPINVP